MFTTNRRELQMATRRRDVAYRPQRTCQAVTNGVVTNFTDRIVGGQMTTSSDSNQWPIRNRLIKREKSRQAQGRSNVPSWWLPFYETRDFGTEGFVTRRTRYLEIGQDADYYFKLNQSGTLNVGYSGPYSSGAVNVGPTSTIWPSMNVNDIQQLYAKGATAISRVLPTNPASGLGVALGELRNDGLPKIAGLQLRNAHTKTQRLRAVGSEYLNVEFGWKPLISDVTSIAKTVQESSRILNQFERDSGRNIRRRFNFPTEVTTTTTEYSNRSGYPALSGYNFVGGSTGTLVLTRATSSDTWFSGCFTYYLSSGDSARERLKRAEQEASKLLGLRMTPDLLYQLAPWSWLIDWNSNLGDVIRNVSAFSNDGLVMRWGYIMCTRTVTDTYSLRGVTLRDGTAPKTQVFSTTEKVRYRATPYGFGLDIDTYSARQWAILAALGISKGPRQL